MPLILRLLALLILLYRRWLSGRGPLRSVRCSFAPHESCSAYGLRMTREAPDARTALARIARRIRRCRDAWLVTDGTTLSWAPLHDLPPSAIVDAMRADGELDPAITRMLGTRRIVAHWRGEPPFAAAIPPPLVASGPAIARRRRRRLVLVAALAVAIVVSIAL